MKILWLSCHFPLVAKGGGDYASARMLESIARSGREVHSVHVCYLTPSAEEAEAFRARFGLASVSFVKMPRDSMLERRLFRLFMIALLPFAPLMYSAFMWPRVRRDYRRILARIVEAAPGAETVVICDGLQAAALLRAEGLDARARYVYRAHNVEREIWLSAARQMPALERAWGIYQAWRVAALERWVVRRFDRVLAICKEDQAVLARACRALGKVHLVPVALTPPAAPEELARARRLARTARERDGLRLLFLGKLDWPPNREGLVWFLEHVWPALLAARPDAALTVVGQGEGALRARYADLAGVQFSGYLDDAALERAFLAHDLLIVPIFSGGGVRIKVLQAALHGLASIGTPFGMRGSELAPESEFIPVDEQPRSWTARLAPLEPDACEALGRRACEKVRRLFSRDIVDQATALALSQIGAAAPLGGEQALAGPVGGE